MIYTFRLFEILLRYEYLIYTLSKQRKGGRKINDRRLERKIRKDTEDEIEKENEKDG